MTDGKAPAQEASAERVSASEPPSSPVAGGGEERDEHDLKWAIARLYQIEADFTKEDTATSRNDAKATLMVLEEINRLQGDEDTGPCCPFCECDPFHYVDNGVGMEAVAVTCCELGDIYFRGERAAPEEVTLSWEEFEKIGQRLLSSPRVEEVRREAIEDAAKKAGEIGREFLGSRDLYVMHGPAGLVRWIERAIRALSPPQGE